MADKKSYEYKTIRVEDTKIVVSGRSVQDGFKIIFVDVLTQQEHSIEVPVTDEKTIKDAIQKRLHLIHSLL